MHLQINNYMQKQKRNFSTMTDFVSLNHLLTEHYKLSDFFFIAKI